jgi:hypothetical protein
MMDKIQLIEKLQYFVEVQLSNMAKTNPVISFFRPIVSRAVKKKLSGITNVLDLIADESGNIDAENIISEMTASLMNTQPFHINVPALGDILIGGGRIEMGIPFTDKSIVLSEGDLVELREILTSKQ